MTVSLLNIVAAFVLFTMMTVVGLELTAADFRRVVAMPRAIAAGTLAQLTVLPVCSGLLLLVYPLPPNIAAGVVLIAASPGGGISNVFCYLAGANTALSVTLTGIASLAAVITLPVLAALGIEWIIGERLAVEVPITALIGQLVFLVLLPISLGMFIRNRAAQTALRYAAPLRRLTLAAIVLLIVIAIASDTTGLAGQVVDGLLVSLIWTAMAMGIGWAIARLVGLAPADAFTFLIEFAVKNVGLAAIIALAVLDRPDLAVFFGAYVLVGYPLAVLASMAWRRLHPSRN
jgi:BASS family bile acid:Na+ symporter